MANQELLERMEQEGLVRIGQKEWFIKFWTKFMGEQEWSGCTVSAMTEASAKAKFAERVEWWDFEWKIISITELVD